MMAGGERACVSFFRSRFSRLRLRLASSSAVSSSSSFSWPAAGLAVLLPSGSDPFFLLPVAVFGLIGLAGLLIAWLGSDRAVSRLWNSRQG